MFRRAWAQGRLVGIFQGEFMFRQNHICVAKVRSMVWSCNRTGCQKHFCIIEYFKVKYMQRCTTALTTHYCLQKKIIFQQKWCLSRAQFFRCRLLRLQPCFLPRIKIHARYINQCDFWHACIFMHFSTCAYLVHK